MSRERNDGFDLEYDPQDQSYRLDYSRAERDELTTTVVAVVSELTGVPLERMALNGVVHPDALNRLFSDRQDGTARDGGTLTFCLAGCEVTVVAHREIRFAPSDGPCGE